MLTAGHCVTDDPSKPPAAESVEFGYQGKFYEVSVKDSKAYVQAGYPGSAAGRDDMALVELEHRVPPQVATAHRPLLQEPTGLLPGAAVIAGYGIYTACVGGELVYGLRHTGSVTARLAQTNVGPMLEAEWSAGDPYVRGGDSGGPMYINGVPAGTASFGGCNDNTHQIGPAYYAETFLPQNAQWIRGMLELPDGRWRGEADVQPAGGAGDPDGDGLSTSNYGDNCPDDYNPDQADSDNDGVGDVCDFCSYAPGNVSGYATDSHIDSNLDTELVDYNGPPPGYGLGDYRPVTKADYPNTGTPFGYSDYIYERLEHYRGDYCEVGAVAPFSLATEAFTPPPGGPHLPCELTKTCLSSNTRIEYDTTVVPGSLLGPPTGKFGFRFCQCGVKADFGKAQGRIKCESECSFDYREFTKPASVWKKVHTSPGGYGATFSSDLHTPDITDTRSVSWQVALDPALWTTPGATGTGIATDGLLWADLFSDTVSSFIKSYEDPDHPLGSSKEADYRARANVYMDGSVRVVHVVRITPGPMVAPYPLFHLPIGCAVCGIGERRPFVYPDPAGRMLLLTGDAAVDVTLQTDDRAFQLLSASAPGRLVPASEPVAVLAKWDNPWTAVRLSDSLEPTGTVVFAHGGFTVPGNILPCPPDQNFCEGPRRRAIATPGSLPPQDAVLVGMATKNRVAALGGTVAGQPSEELWQLDLATRAWTPVALRGPDLPRHIVAATYRFAGDALYAVDEIGDHPGLARVFRIDRSGGTKLIASFPRIAHSDVSLATGEHDELVFGLSTQHGHAVLVANVVQGKLAGRAFSVGAGKLLATPQLSERWLTLMVERRGKAQAVDLRREKLVKLHGLAPCARWW